jgi:hypothetical protein
MPENKIPFTNFVLYLLARILSQCANHRVCRVEPRLSGQESIYKIIKRLTYVEISRKRGTDSYRLYALLGDRISPYIPAPGPWRRRHWLLSSCLVL